MRHPTHPLNERPLSRLISGVHPGFWSRGASRVVTPREGGGSWAQNWGFPFKKCLKFAWFRKKILGARGVRPLWPPLSTAGCICHSHDEYANYGGDKGQWSAGKTPPEWGKESWQTQGYHPPNKGLPQEGGWWQWWWTPPGSGDRHQTIAWPNEVGYQSNIAITPWSDIGVETPMGSSSLGQTGNWKHLPDDVMPCASPGNRLVMSTRGSRMTIYYK